jgi:hypothetical protein
MTPERRKAHTRQQQGDQQKSPDRINRTHPTKAALLFLAWENVGVYNAIG